MKFFGDSVDGIAHGDVGAERGSVELSGELSFDAKSSTVVDHAVALHLWLRSIGAEKKSQRIPSVDRACPAQFLERPGLSVRSHSDVLDRPRASRSSSTTPLESTTASPQAVNTRGETRSNTSGFRTRARSLPVAVASAQSSPERLLEHRGRRVAHRALNFAGMRQSSIVRSGAVTGTAPTHAVFQVETSAKRRSIPSGSFTRRPSHDRGTVMCRVGGNTSDPSCSEIAVS